MSTVDEWRVEHDAHLERMRGVVEAARALIADPADRRKAPPAGAFIDSGMRNGYVFGTARKHVVVRVGPITSFEREQLLLDDDFVGGTVRVYNLVIVDDAYVVSWKERINEFVEAHIRRSLPEAEALEILHALSGIGWSRDLPDRLRILRSWRGTRRFARAVGRGLPLDDVDLSMNIGVTRKGRVVAFDL